MLAKVEKMKRIKLWVTLVGISLIPALYNFIFLSSMWDPYGRLDNLPVAVVNYDQEATLNDKTLNIGADMVEKMEDSQDLDFHIVSEKEAKSGLKAGDYYMVVTLPEDLSQKATTLMTDNPQKPEIDYQTSKGHSFVAAKMSDSAMTSLKKSVSETITETYTSAVFDNMRSLQTGMKDASSGGQELLSGSQRLADGSKELEDGLSVLSQGTGDLSTGVGKLNSGLSQYTNGVGQLALGVQQLSDGVTAYTDGAAQLASGAQRISQNSAALLDGAQQLAAGSTDMQPLVDGASQLAAGLTQLSNASALSQENRDQINQLIAGLPQLHAALTQLSTSVSGMTSQVNTDGITTSLTDIASQAQSILSSAEADRAASLSAVQATSAYQNMTADQQAEISSAISQSPSNVEMQAQTILMEVGSMQQGLAGLGQLSGQMAQMQAGVSQLNSQAQIALPGAATALGNLMGGMDQINTVLSQQMSPASQQIATGVTTLQTKIAQGTSQLSAGLTTYTGAVDQLATGGQTLVSENAALTSGSQQVSAGLATLETNSAALVSGGQELANGTTKLNSGANQLENGAGQLSDGATTLTEGVDTLTTSLQDASDQLSLVSVSEGNAQAVSNPVKTTKTDKDQVATNGVGLAPYMMAVSLMVVGISANVIFAKSLDGKNFANRWAWAKSKLLLNGTIATVAALLLFGAVRLVGLEPAHPVATVGFTILIAWTLMALVTALIGWNSRYGSFVALILLLLQLGSSAGTYPIELSPSFFGKIQPFLPVSYAVSGLRQTISMSGAIGGQVLALILFFILFCGVGLLTFRAENDD